LSGSSQLFFLVVFQGLLVNVLIDIHQGLVGWELAKGTTFPYKKIFVPRTHVLVQILVNFGGNFFLQEIKRDVGRVGDGKEYRTA